MKSKLAKNVTLVIEGCCDLLLQSISKPESKVPVLCIPAVHQCWADADLYDRQTCILVTAVVQGCCNLFLQGLGFTNHYERQSSLGVTAVIQGCCLFLSQSSTEPESMCPEKLC